MGSNARVHDTSLHRDHVWVQPHPKAQRRDHKSKFDVAGQRALHATQSYRHNTVIDRGRQPHQTTPCIYVTSALLR
eukprot:COSAG02_NODE_18953_length_908_cov_22.638530_1_plen_75_part_10